MGPVKAYGFELSRDAFLGRENEKAMTLVERSDQLNTKFFQSLLFTRLCKGDN